MTHVGKGLAKKRNTESNKKQIEISTGFVISSIVKKTIAASMKKIALINYHQNGTGTTRSPAKQSARNDI